MKTPEQMAEEYLRKMWGHDGDATEEMNCVSDFLAGYEARVNEERFCVYCNDLHAGDCAIGRGRNYRAWSEPQWISAGERLPEAGQEVLIYTKGKETYMARIYKGGEAWPISNSCGCCGTDEPFTHWMPLPEPPRDAK